MSNQEPQNQNKTTEEAAVDKRRRFIKGAGVATPVILTLSSPSVFGALCRSEIMSGNESHTGAGSCVLGESRNYWKSPTAQTEWNNLGFTYGTPTSSPGSTTDCSNSAYTGGTVFTAIFGSGSGKTMREILCASDPIRESYYVAAILNAKKYPTSYILDDAHVFDLWNHPQSSPTGSLPPGYADDMAFLASTLKTTP
ncbi:MAG: hypothetical protein LUO94_13460 [Methylococcaceae bacterium]|nr:hypothetical protein [Methylococcaceae bacterium]